MSEPSIVLRTLCTGFDHIGSGNKLHIKHICLYPGHPLNRQLFYICESVNGTNVWLSLSMKSCVLPPLN